MREIRQSGSEGGGNEQTVSPYPYLAPRLFLILSFTSYSLIRSLFKDRVVAMGKTTATTPFEPLDFAPRG